jgi:hypothetical protein
LEQIVFVDFSESYSWLWRELARKLPALTSEVDITLKFFFTLQMPFVKLVKNKAYYKRYQTKYRRRRGKLAKSSVDMMKAYNATMIRDYQCSFAPI